LRNEPVAGTPVLPLDPATVGSIALIGRLADAPNMGELGSSQVHPPSFVTPREGILAAFPAAEVVVVVDDDPEAAAAAASRCDVAVVVAGFDHHDEGEYVDPAGMTTPELLALMPPMSDEDMAGFDLSGPTMGDAIGGDRASLALRPVDEEIIRAVAGANPRTVVAVVAAGAVLMEAWRHDVAALMVMWYAGMEGGHALADVLTGADGPSGRLPFSIPTSDEHLPTFDREAEAITYDRWHGQRLLDRLGVEAAYPHGFGLGYTTFALGPVTVTEVTDDGCRLAVTVANTGDRDGRHVVQVYGHTTTGPYADERFVVGFAPVAVAAGGAVTVEVDVAFLPLAHWDGTRRVLPSAADVVVEVGAHAHDPQAVVVRPGG
jgi:beta-glucosidase